MAVKQESPAVAVARAHAEAWSNHDWDTARKMLAPDVHVTATTTQPIMPATDLNGVDEYMDGLIKFAGAVELGSARVIASVGDERNSLILLTVRAAFAPGGPAVTIPAARLAQLDENNKNQGRAGHLLRAFGLMSKANHHPKEELVAQHKVVPHQEWLAARKQHLAEEKDFTRRRDHLSQARRDLPWEAVDKEYVFEGPQGRQTLAELFDGRGQLVVYHAMFDSASASPSTSWTEDAACPYCSWWMDNFNGIVVHLNHRDVTMVGVSRAPYSKIAAYKKRMGWTFNWVSSGDTDFNRDFGVSFSAKEVADGKADYNYDSQNSWQTEAPGVSVFTNDGDSRIFHTYSTYARGLDMVNVAYRYLDLVPKGRGDEVHGPNRVRRTDEYED